MCLTWKYKRIQKCNNIVKAQFWKGTHWAMKLSSFLSFHLEPIGLHVHVFIRPMTSTSIHVCHCHISDSVGHYNKLAWKVTPIIQLIYYSSLSHAGRRPFSSILDDQDRLLMFRDRRLAGGWLFPGASGALHFPSVRLLRKHQEWRSQGKLDILDDRRSRDAFSQRLGLGPKIERLDLGKSGKVSISVSSPTGSETSRSRLGLGPQRLVYIRDLWGYEPEYQKAIDRCDRVRQGRQTHGANMRHGKMWVFYLQSSKSATIVASVDRT